MPPLGLHDFDYYRNNAEIEAILEVLAPLTGEGSLLIRWVSGTADHSLNAAPLVSFPHGLTVGQLTVACTQQDFASVSIGYGLCCMQSQRDLTSAGDAYGLYFTPVDGTLSLVRITGGLDAGLTVLDTTTVGVGAESALRLGWAVAPDSLSIALAGGYGTLFDQSDITPVLSAQVTSSPLVTSVAEGVFLRDSTGADFACWLDTLRLTGVV